MTNLVKSLRHQASARLLACIALASVVSTQAFAHIVASTNLDESPHWLTEPYNLRFDAKWIAIGPNDDVELNGRDELIVKGRGDFSKPAPYGVRFGLREPWESFVSGHTIRVTLIARSSDNSPMRYKVRYSTNEVGSSPYYFAIANKQPTRFSFDYTVPQIKEGKNDLIFVVPEDDDKALVLIDGFVELIKE